MFDAKVQPARAGRALTKRRSGRFETERSQTREAFHDQTSPQDPRILLAPALLAALAAEPGGARGFDEDFRFAELKAGWKGLDGKIYPPE